MSQCKTEWLSPLEEGSHACFFYTTPHEFFEIATPYLKEAFSSKKERAFWVLPPNFTPKRALALLQEDVEFDLQALLKMRRLIVSPWNQWYGKEISTQELLTLGRRIVKVTLKEGYERLRVLTHAPAKTSPYWRDFLSIRELIVRKRGIASLTFCAYSLLDCPTAAISAIAENHHLCLVHHGSEWEWLPHTPTPKQKGPIPKSNVLHS